MALQHTYQDLERTSHLMVSAARQANWQEVQRLECVAAQQICALRAKMVATRPSLKECQSRHRALLAVLRHEAEVRALAEPDMHRQYAEMRFPTVKSDRSLPINQGNY
jgi:flagellar protein FliT